MRRLLLALALVLSVAVPARAQNCVTINGISRCAMPWQVYDTAQRQVSTPVLDLTQTWNQVTTTFTGLKVNVTDTNSASGSLLLDLQVGGTSKFSVNKSGNLVAAGTFTAGATTVGGALTFPNGTKLNDTIASGKLTITGTTPMIQLGGTTASFPSLLQNGTRVDFKLADGSAFADAAISNAVITNQIQTSSGGMLFPMSATNPTISSGFGSSPSVPSGNGATTFRVNVGTGGVATSGVVAMGVTAATGWNCQVVDFTTNTVTRETANTTTTVTVTAAAAWAASDILIFNCAAY
jgi:hypothetical protein